MNGASAESVSRRGWVKPKSAASLPPTAGRSRFPISGGRRSWFAENKDKYAFVTAYDPAGIPARGAVAKPLYVLLSSQGPGYLRMPETFVMDAEGKFVGCAYADNITGAGLGMLLQRSGIVR